jgi:hypothetical protein
MTTIGIISFLLGCVFLYIYLTRIKGGRGGKLSSAAKLRALQEQTAEKQRGDEPSLEHAQPGASIHIDDVGLRSESVDAKITSRHLHKAGPDRWLELEADRGGAALYITIQRDDALSISATLAQPSPQSLGLTAADLDAIGEGWQLTYDGTVYAATAHGQATFCRDHNELQPEPYEFWELEDDAEEQYLTLVRWQDGSLEANYSVKLRPSSITVYTAS